jgi:hypothetical protein
MCGRVKEREGGGRKKGRAREGGGRRRREVSSRKAFRCTSRWREELHPMPYMW